MGLRVRPGLAGLALAIPGLLSFGFGVVAENMNVNRKRHGALRAPGVVYDEATNTSTCHYGSDPSLYLGILSVIFLFLAAQVSIAANFYPYGGKVVSIASLWKKCWAVVVFTVISTAVYLVSETLYLWALFLEFRQRHDNVHIGHIDQCPTVKSGLYSGAAFLALDATLFFLISLMLTANARSDLLDRDEVDDRGFYGEVTTYPPPGLHAPE